ncbi:MAG: hypothetical protein JW829_00540 [Pirellulales bacterium]|nr:hypothetical protein [Pirellulales bacterium]
MKQFDLVTGAAKLQEALENLQLQWQQSADQWRDNVSHQFAKNHLDPLSPIIKSTVDAIGRMANVIDQAERDCLDQERSQK